MQPHNRSLSPNSCVRSKKSGSPACCRTLWVHRALVWTTTSVSRCLRLQLNTFSASAAIAILVRTQFYWKFSVSLVVVWSSIDIHISNLISSASFGAKMFAMPLLYSLSEMWMRHECGHRHFKTIKLIGRYHIFHFILFIYILTTRRWFDLLNGRPDRAIQLVHGAHKRIENWKTVYQFQGQLKHFPSCTFRCVLISNGPSQRNMAHASTNTRPHIHQGPEFWRVLVCS